MQELYKTYRIIPMESIPEMVREIIHTPNVMRIIYANDIDFYGFRLMLHEVLCNAVEHGHQKKFLPLSIRITENENHLTIEILDSGNGFQYPPSPPNYEENYFSPRGRGLALIIAYGYTYQFVGKGNHIIVDYKMKHQGNDGV